jgi:hypothetical protein
VRAQQQINETLLSIQARLVLRPRLASSWLGVADLLDEIDQRNRGGSSVSSLT